MASVPPPGGYAEAGLVTFPGDFVLEGTLEWPDFQPLRGGVVLAHPHPLHGATMAQPVVYRCAQACRERGFATLRFNFRGVGGSMGAYSGHDEYRDVEAAAVYLREQLREATASGTGPETGSVPEAGSGTDPEAAWNSLPLAVVGYSFGSVQAAVSAVEVVPDILVLIGFVVRSELVPTRGVGRLRGFPNPILAVTGENDELAPAAAAREALKELGVDFEFTVIRDTGHFFEERRLEVAEVVASFISDRLP